MSMSRYVVIGAGLAGSATAWSLSRRGHEVTLVERTQPAAHDGSSHGSARIFRYAYPDPFYADLVRQVKTRWDELEMLSGQQLISPTGSLDFGLLRDPAQLARVLESLHIDHEMLSAASARARWPQVAFDTEVLWHPGAGVLDPERSVEAMVGLARSNGAAVLTDWPVSRVERSNTGYRVVSEQGQAIEAEKVVVSVGGWLPRMLASLSLPEWFSRSVPPLEVRQEQAYHFPYRNTDPHQKTDPYRKTERSQLAIWPTFIHKSPWISTYSLPGGRDAGFRGQKLAEYRGGKIIPSASAQDGQVDAVNRVRVIEYAARYLPGVIPEPYAETTCLFTTTPTEDFIIDEADGITLLSPCSGHGAKFGPLLGEIAADLATGQRRSPSPFQLRGQPAEARWADVQG